MFTFFRDGTTLLSTGDDGTLREWDVATGTELAMPGCQRWQNAWARALARSSHGRNFARPSLGPRR